MATPRSFKPNLAVALAAALSACGGDSDDGDGGSTEDQGVLNISVTDAPVDRAAHVFLEFTGLVVKPASDDAREFNFAEPR
jgi:hypothetical protein